MSLTTRFTDWGRQGERTHTTREDVGTVSIEDVRYLLGVNGEYPGAHRNRHGQAWEDFKDDIAANGIQFPIHITIDWGGEPEISEGNHRRDAAIELGLAEVPVQVTYFGRAEEQGIFGEGRPLGLAAELWKKNATHYYDVELPDSGTLDWREFIQVVRPGQYMSPDYADNEYGYWEYALAHTAEDLRGSWTNTDPDPYWRSVIEGIKRNGITEPVEVEQDDLEYYLMDGHHRVAIARGFDIDVPYVVVRRAIP